MCADTYLVAEDGEVVTGVQQLVVFKYPLLEETWPILQVFPLHTGIRKCLEARAAAKASMSHNSRLHRVGLGYEHAARLQAMF
jgi:hypothetical protein